MCRHLYSALASHQLKIHGTRSQARTTRRLFAGEGSCSPKSDPCIVPPKASVYNTGDHDRKSTSKTARRARRQNMGRATQQRARPAVIRAPARAKVRGFMAGSKIIRIDNNAGRHQSSTRPVTRSMTSGSAASAVNGPKHQGESDSAL